MDKNFIELLIWIIAYEFTKDHGTKDDHQKVFQKICDLLSKSQDYNISIINDGPISESQIELGKKIINFYNGHLMKQYDDRDNGTMILIDIPLSNGKYERDFRVKTMIGYGSFGNVDQAVNVLDHKEYAIKKVPLYESMPEKILREIRIWSKVSESQYLVQYNTSWTENIDDDIERMNQDKARKSTSESNSTIDVSPLSGHILYIQMELCRMTLKDAITKINDELNQRIGLQMTIIGAFIATQLTDEIANGVHYLHSSSPPIIHRDLKPENIFITDGRGGNYIKIGDLGLATFHCGNDDDSSEESKKPKHVNEHTCGRGTKEYMAPEVRYSTEYNEKSDAYSLGCIMAELFCIEKSKFDNTVPWDANVCLNARDNKDIMIIYKSLEEGSENHKVIHDRIDRYIENVSRLIFNVSGARGSVYHLYTSKNKWLLTIKDIIEEPQLRDIVLKKNFCDKICMNPLSDYIVIDKWMIERERELSEMKAPDSYGMMRDAILSDKMKIFSDFDGRTEQRIMDIMKHAFCVYVSSELIRRFITGHVQTIFDSGSWEFQYYAENSFRFHLPYDNMKMIHWKNEKFFCAYHHETDEVNITKCLLIFVNDIGIQQTMDQVNSPLKHYNEIVNTFNNDITEALIEMISDLRKKLLSNDDVEGAENDTDEDNESDGNNDSDNDDADRDDDELLSDNDDSDNDDDDNDMISDIRKALFYYDNHVDGAKNDSDNDNDSDNGEDSDDSELLVSDDELSNDEFVLMNDDDDENLVMIRNIIGDENAFCYASKYDKILIYNVNDPFTIKCKYAATMNNFYFAVFTLENHSNNALISENLGFKNKGVSWYWVLKNLIMIQYSIKP